MNPDFAAHDHAILAMLARAAEAKGADRKRAITLAESALTARIGMRHSLEKTLAMFDEVEAAASSSA